MYLRKCSELCAVMFLTRVSAAFEGIIGFFRAIARTVAPATREAISSVSFVYGLSPLFVGVKSSASVVRLNTA